MSDRLIVYEDDEAVGEIDLATSDASYEGTDDFARYVIEKVDAGIDHTVSGSPTDDRVPVRSEQLTGDDLEAYVRPLLEDVDGLRVATEEE